jgi:hypothetical protein
LKKWKKTHYSLKEDYLRAVANIETLKDNIFYSIHANTRDYIRLTSDAIAEAFTQRARGPYTVTVAIDGLSPTSAQKVAKHLKAEGIHYRKVRGVRDESSAWIRLADAIAGFVRDVQENKPYTSTLYSYLTQQGLLSEIKNAGVSGSSDPT